MSKYCHNRSKLPSSINFKRILRSIRSRNIAFLRKIIRKGVRFLVYLKFTEDNLDYLCCAIFIVLVRSLNEWKTINIANIGLAAWAKHIKTTNFLFECLTNSPSILFFFIRQVNWIAHFFASLLVPLDFTINWWSFPGLSMCVLFANCVYFYVKTIGGQEFFVDIRAFGSQGGLVISWNELWAFAVSLSKKNAIATATRTVVAVMDNNCVILCIDWLFYERFVKSLASNQNVIIIFLNIRFKVFK